MRKMNKSAFTLVELIVVITILAILATVAFISFGGQTSKAKNAKVTSDLSQIAAKVNLLGVNGEATVQDIYNGTSLTNNLMTGTGAGLVIGDTGVNYGVSNVNFFKLKEKQENFQDTSWDTARDYIYGYISKDTVAVFNIAGQTTDAAGTIKAVVKGSYYEADANDIDSLISANGAITAVKNNDTLTTAINLY